MGLDWDDKWYMRLLHRERISTKNTIGNTIYRRQLDKRAFRNDPDVYLLREDNIQLTKQQKYTLATVNGLFGGLLFTSDNVKDYDEEKWTLYRRVRKLGQAKKTVNKKGKITTLTYESDGMKEKLHIRL